MIAEAEKNGYQYVKNASELAKVKGSKVLGLFADEAMAPELEREGTGQPSLLDMTEAAISALKKDKDGFFLMVEGSQIDWAGHAHDAAWAMTDTEAFDKAVEAALKFAEKDGNTLVVVAGDHETGGMSVGSNGLYDLNIDVLHQVKATGNQMASELNANRSNVKEVVKKHTGFDLTNDEAAKIAVSSTPHIAINELVSDRALEALLPANYDKAQLSVNCVYSANRLSAPVEQGQRAGVVQVYYQEKLLGTADLVTQRALALSGKDAFMASVGRFFQHPTVTLLVKIAGVLLALLLIVTLVLAILRSRRKNAAQRKAIQRYLQEDRQQFLQDKKKYRQKRLEKRKARQKAMRRLRDNYRRYKLEKQSPAPKPKPTSPPARPPQAPPAPPRRPGDEYYRK